MRPVLSLSGHLGDRTAALVDGQLAADEAERAWQHVLRCPGCREAVEHQAVAKRALGGLRATPEPRATWLDSDALVAWHQVTQIERRAQRRPAVVAGGVLTVSLVLALGVTGAVLLDDDVTPLPSPASVGGASSPQDRGETADPQQELTPTDAGTTGDMWRDGSRWTGEQRGPGSPRRTP